MRERLLLGIDIGGTKIEVALFKAESGLNNQPLSKLVTIKRERVPTLRHKGLDFVLANLIKHIHNVAEQHIDAIDSIGIGMPGSVDPKSHRMINGNSQIWINHDIVSSIRAGCNSFRGPIAVNNDANCFALAERVMGAGKTFAESFGLELENMTTVGIILGTGVGSGIVSSLGIWQGASGGGGEFGHTFLAEHPSDCFCGRNGCAEQFLSGPAILSNYLRNHPKSSFNSPMDLFSLGYENNYFIQLRSFWHRFLINISNAVNPHLFILGGGLSNQSFFYEGSDTELRNKSFVKTNPPTVVKHQLGDSAGVIGAALMGFDLL